MTFSKAPLLVHGFISDFLGDQKKKYSFLYYTGFAHSASDSNSGDFFSPLF